MTHWQVLAGPGAGAPSVELTKATNRKASFALSEASTFKFDIDGRHTQAAEVNELATDVHLLRDGVPIYTGRVGATEDQIEGDKHTVNVATSDTRELLARREWHTEPQVVYTAVEQATIASDLINDAQSRSGGDLGISTASVQPTGVTTTRTIRAGTSILAEMQWLATVGDPTQSAQPGFDWDISAGWQGRELQLWYPQRGANKGVVLDYVFTGRPRSSIVAKVQRKVDPSSFANALRVVGGIKHETITERITIVNSDGTTSSQDVQGTIDTPTAPVWEEAADIATTPAGRWEMAAAYPDIVDQGPLDSKGAQLLAQFEQITPTYTVSLRRNAWDGPDHIWLGDTVRLIINSGRINVDISLRVLGLDLTLGDSGEVDVDLKVGTAPVTVLRKLRAMEQRLALLERGV